MVAVERDVEMAGLARQVLLANGAPQVAVVPGAVEEPNGAHIQQSMCPGFYIYIYIPNLLVLERERRPCILRQTLIRLLSRN